MHFQLFRALMSLFLLAGCLFVAIGIWYLYGKADNGQERKQMPQPPGTSPDNDNRPTVEDPFILQMVSLKQKMDEEVENSREENERHFCEQFSSDRDLMQRLSLLARELELDKALIAVWDEIEFYPEWSKRDDFEKWNKLNLRDIQGSREGKEIAFNYGGRSYKLGCQVSLSPLDTEVDEDFVLYEEGEEVFAICCAPQFNGHVTEHKCVAIKGFKRRGQWAESLLEMYKVIRIEREKSLIEFKASSISRAKQRFEE